MSLHGLRLLLGTRRGWRLFALNVFAAFGLISALVQFYSAVVGSARGFPQPGLVIFVVAVVSLVYGLVRGWPRRQVHRDFGRPDMAVAIKVGNLFDEQAHWVVGFSDTFDTDTTDNLVINRESLQGQLLAGEYKDDVRRLDKELAEAVCNSSPVVTEQRASKPQGKLTRYPIGTVATLRTPARYIFAVAYSRMGNNLVARSTVPRFMAVTWESLGRCFHSRPTRTGRRTAHWHQIGAGGLPGSGEPSEDAVAVVRSTLA